MKRSRRGAFPNAAEAQPRPSAVCICEGSGLRFFGLPPGDGLPARFLSCGLHQHTRRRALRHKRQTEAVFTGADQQLFAARADQERIGFAQIVRSVRDAVADAADKRHTDRHIARPIENRFHRPEAAPHLFKIIRRLIRPVQLNRAALHHHIEFVGDSASNEKILSILTYLNAHLTEDLSIDDLASRFYLSRSYLMHTFKEQTGYTIGGYLLTKRLFLAKELIAAGTPITEVCYSCGFQNYSTFSRAYKKSFGESPRDYRQSL